jgi:taurine dioxygenase
MAPSFQRGKDGGMIEFSRLAPAIGAEVTGVSWPLPESERGRLRDGLHEHLVLVFHDQDIDEAKYVELARCFGVPVRGSDWNEESPHFPEIHILEGDSPKGKGADSWHADCTYEADPPVAIMLRSMQPPAEGGDTCYASMYAAYEALSPAVQGALDQLTAVHDIRKTLGYGGDGPKDLEDIIARYPAVEHPVVRTHPVTGRKALFVNRHHTVRINGLSERENELFLPFLFEHVASPEFQYRVHWRKGTVTVWDNWSTQHLGVPDYTTRRVMQRIAVNA